MTREEREILSSVVAILEAPEAGLLEASRIIAAERLRALLDAPEPEAPRGDVGKLAGTDGVYLIESYEAVNQDGTRSVVPYAVGLDVECPTREDAEAVAEMLRDVGRRLRNG